MARIVTDDPARVCKFVSERIGAEDWNNCRAIGLERNGELVAGVVYDYFTGVNICMHIAARPGRRWMTKKFLWFIFYYPFVQLGVNRLTGIIPESNIDSVRFAEGLKNCHLEARLENAHPDGDMLIYRMWKKDCTYLEINDGKT